MNVLTIDHVTPLHEACVGDHVACARALIDAGANVSHVLAFNVTMLHRSNVIFMVGKIWVGVTNEQCAALPSSTAAVELLSCCSPSTVPPGCCY